MAVGAFDTGTPQSDAVKHRDIVTNDSRLAHHDARTVVDEHALSEFGAGVDVYLELLVDLRCVHGSGRRYSSSRWGWVLTLLNHWRMRFCQQLETNSRKVMDGFAGGKPHKQEEEAML